MKCRSAIGLLVVSNVVFCATLIYFLSSRPSRDTQAKRAAAPAAPMPTQSAMALATVLSWSALESTDYHVYLANLRAMQCPEETIRDIITADVRKHYAQRRAALPRPPRAEFWRAQSPDEKTALAAFQSHAAALEREEEGVLSQLFGADWRARMARQNPELDFDEHIYGTIPADKRQKIRAILADYERAQSLADDVQASQLKHDLDRRLAEVLTPAELEEYRVRNSETAESLRTLFANAPLDRETFLAAFRVQKQIDDLSEVPAGPGDASALDARADAREQLEAQLSTVLGEQRFAEYERAQDPKYQDLVRVSQEQNLAPEAPVAAYETLQQAEEVTREIQLNPALNKQQEAQLIQQVDRQVESTFESVFGKEVGARVYDQFRLDPGQAQYEGALDN